MRNRYWLATLAAVLIALALRTLSMWQSPLPFNPDGIHQARWAGATLRNGVLPLADVATDDLLFPPLLATVARVLGVDPMRLAQPLTAAIGAAPVVLAIAVTRRLARRWGWSRGTTFMTATLAGVVLAVEGLYLHRSMAADEQIVGLLFVPLAAVLVARAYVTGRYAWYLAAAPLLVALAPLHNLDATVLALVLTVATALAVARAPLRRVAPLALLTLGFWLYVGSYHLSVATFTPAEITQQTRVTAIPGLVLAWVLLVAIGGAWFVRTSVRTQRLVFGGLFGTLFALLAVNAVVTVFPGTPSTHPLLLAGVLPLVVPTALALWVAPALDLEYPEGLTLWSLLVAPFILIGVSLTASLTPEYLATAYRTTTFLHFPWAVLTAVGTAAVARRVGSVVSLSRPRVRQGLQAGLAVLVIVAAAASLPVAFGGLSVLNYKGITTPGELDASRFATAHANGTWAGDNHLVRIQPPDGTNGTVRPIFEWLRGGAGPPDCLVLAQESWTTTGAQLFPAPPDSLPASTYHAWLQHRSVIYRGGAGDPIVAVAPEATRC